MNLILSIFKGQVRWKQNESINGSSYPIRRVVRHYLRSNTLLKKVVRTCRTCSVGDECGYVAIRFDTNILSTDIFLLNSGYIKNKNCCKHK